MKSADSAPRTGYVEWQEDGYHVTVVGREPVTVATLAEACAVLGLPLADDPPAPYWPTAKAYREAEQ